MPLWIGVAGMYLVNLLAATATTTTNVSVQDFSFSPANVTINVGDTVRWTWADSGLYLHNSTGPGTPALWASPSTGTPNTTFSYTFVSGGSFPYKCTFHAFIGMTGNVTVQEAATNVPPSVALTSPANGAVFAAPWTGTIHATASDSDDTVSKVDFYANGSLLGTVLNPPANLSLGVTNLAAATYTLKAVATDSRGGTNTSAVITVQVLAPSPITLSSAKRPSSSSFEFSYSATPGLSYVISRSPTPAVLSAISTNAATNSTMTFIDQGATNRLNFYRVHVLPNP